MTLALTTFSLMFMLGLSGLTFHRIHLLSVLLCLESMMLSIFIAFSLWIHLMDSNNFSASPLLLLAFSACEASVGLALMVATARTHGSDRINNLNLLQC